MAAPDGGIERGPGEGERIELPQNWSSFDYLGAALLFVFLLQVASGVLLMAYYRPVPQDAYASVWWIMNEVRLGAVVRQIHARGTDILLAVMAVHLGGMLWRRAYRWPRGLTWIIGAVIFTVSAAFAFTGILLPWNETGYWLADATRKAISEIPIVGGLILQVLWGGQEITDETLLRFYVFHVGILPWAVALLISLHLLLVWRHGLSSERSPGARVPLVPDFALNVFLVGLLSGGVVLSAGVLAGVPIGSKANPLAPVAASWVPWYFAVVEGVFERLPLAGALAALSAGSGFLLALPFIDRAAAGARWLGHLLVVIGFVLVGVFLLGGLASLLSL